LAVLAVTLKCESQELLLACTREFNLSRKGKIIDYFMSRA